MAPTVTDPTREETEAAAELLSEILRQPNDGYLISVAEDMLRAAARVRLCNGARVKLATSCMDRIGVPDALVRDCFGIASIDRLGAIIGFEADIAGEQAFDRVVRS